MNKEDILLMLQSQILALRDHSKELQSDPRLMQDWVAKSKTIIKATEGLSSCDTLWLEDRYGAWFKKEIQPSASKINPSILKS